MRIGGMASGMDTDQIIKDLMKAQRIPLDKIAQKKSYLEWQVNDYRAVNRQLFDFSQNTFNNMILSKNFNYKTVSVSSDDVAIKNMSSSSEFAGNIEVHRLATTTILHGETLKTGSGFSDKNGNELTADKYYNTSLEDLGLATGFTSLTVTTQIGDKSKVEVLEFSKFDSIAGVIAKINEKTGASAFFDSGTGVIAMSAKDSGAGTISVTAGNREGSEDLSSALKLGGPSKSGQNAIFTFNGLQTERSSNTFQLNGFEVNLKQVTSPLVEDANGSIEIDGKTYKVADGGKSVSFTSSPDTDKIFDSIVKYIDDYNNLIEDLNKKIREPKYRSYQPLTSEQKADMKEKEIELWEEKAKSGTLRNDSDISSMLSKMRTVLMGSFGEGEGKMSLKDIGITTSKSYLENGKLVIDEKELKKAIAEDPSKLHKMFAFDEDEDKSKHGFARQIRAVVDETQKSIQQRAGKVGDVNDTFLLGKTLDDMNKQIDRFEERMKMVENRYWKQFTAMETAIQRANAQSANMMSMFGGQ
ncbi:flagellar hook-associated protein 2 [Sporosarcina luteola]|nr:flagellar hook-associated protein 2 [Sporosarcina luteola]